MDSNKIEQHQLSLRLNDLRRDALESEIKSAYRRYYRKLLSDPESEIKEYMLQQAVKEIGRESFVKVVPDKRKWFITINAKEGIDPVQFFNQMVKCLKKEKLHGSGSYVLEQRSEADQDPYGYHIHWRVEFKEQFSKSVYAQQVYQCFSRFLCGVNYVDLKPWNDTQLKYMDGQKTADKMAKVEKDRIVRKKYLLPEKIVY